MPAHRRSASVTAAAGDPVCGTIVAYDKPAMDADGNVRTMAYGHFGDVEMEMFFFSPARVDTATLTAWLRQQSTILAGSPRCGSRIPAPRSL